MTASSRRLVGALVAAAATFTLVLAKPVLGLGGGDHVFLREHAGEPVTWNHCKAIPFQVNPLGAPPHWRDVVDDAVADIEAASGFVLADRGTTTKRELIGERYDGNEWEPVLIMWSDRYQSQQLEGSTIGYGGSGPIEVGARLRYVVGRVVLDTTSAGGVHEQQLVLEHELGHVLGLGHAKSRHELMYAAYVGQDGLGEGDLAGLKALHDVPCD